MISKRALDAIEVSDTDDLLRVIDGYCASKAWNELLELRSRCREAVGRGKQLWGVEEHVRYRLALEAPGEIAGPVVSEGDARFALGPLAEVVASSKTWAELEPHLEAGPTRQTVAAERVIRGEPIDVDLGDLPSTILPWEPNYPLATYKADKVEAPSPNIPTLSEAILSDQPKLIDDVASVSALADLVQPWTDESNGRCQVASVQGDQRDAIRALGPSHARIGHIASNEALGWLAWAGASGGAHGRRRGSAAGRYLGWWVISNLADLEWPPNPGDIGVATQRFGWYWFDDGSPDTGWFLRLAIADPEIGLAWAISASDSA
jgi:hypothetical protein